MNDILNLAKLCRRVKFSFVNRVGNKVAHVWLVIVGVSMVFVFGLKKLIGDSLVSN